MPNLYARATALPNVVGRVDYISSNHRQERFLAACDGAADLLEGQFWRQLAKESQAAFAQFGYEKRTGHKEKLKCCEGRELVIQLANALLQRMDPEEIVKTVVDEFREKLGLTVIAGLHLKHYANAEDNLHVHVIFPERELLKEPVIKIADRALFFDAQGKRRYKKSEILDENKRLLPGCRIVKKGEIYEQRYFSSVDPKYSSKAWMKDVKTNVILPLRNGKLKGDVEITEFDRSSGKLPQQHVGTVEYVDSDAARETVERIREYNRFVVHYNQLVDFELQQSGRRPTFVYGLIAGKSDKNAALKGVIDRMEYHQKRKYGRTIVARRDWDVQRLLDASRIAKRLGVKQITDLKDKKDVLGREIRQAREAFEEAERKYGPDSIAAKMAAAEEEKAIKAYATAMRAAEDLLPKDWQNDHEVLDTDDR